MTADVREGGRWSLAQRAKNDVLFVLATTSLAIASRLPPRLLRALGRGLGGAAWLLVPSARRLAFANVARALPELGEGERRDLVRRVYRELGGYLGETVASLRASRPISPLPFVAGSRACLDEAVARGRGVIFASAHLGSWERVAASLVAAGVPMTVVAREAYDPRLTRVYEQLRERRGVRTVYRGASGAGVALLRVLKRGGVLGIPMDLASRVPSVAAPFLGTVAPTPSGPARLALRTGAAVVVGTAAPEGIAISPIATDDLESDGAEAELTARINAELSSRIRAMPEAWVWMHDRWPKTS